MSISKSLSSGLLGLLGVFSVGLPAQATPLELQVFQAIDAQPQSYCPPKVTVMEQPQPYREGGYTIDGSANLVGIADRFSIVATDDFSVTWAAKLKPAYSKCKATGRIVKQADEPYQGFSHIRLRLVSGKVYLILDMTGMSDANQLTPMITKKNVVNGNPVWSWSGTD